MGTSKETDETYHGSSLLGEIPADLLRVADEVCAAALRGVPTDVRNLARAVADMSRAYTLERASIADASRDPRLLAARVRFFMPRDLPKIVRPLEELARVDALPGSRTWRVLDVGAGVGTSSLGVAWFAKHTAAAEKLDVIAIDRDRRALGLFEKIAARSEEAGLVPMRAQSLDASVDTALRSTSTAGPFDLIVAGFVLNELSLAHRDDALESQCVLLSELSRRLAPNGSMIVLEPALRETSRALHRIRDRLVATNAPPYVFAPCLHAGPCPMLMRERDWCHEDVPRALPEPLVEVAQLAGLRFERLTYSYLTLRNDPRSLRDLAPNPRGEIYRIVGGPERTKGKLEIFGCGKPGKPRFMRVDRHTSPANADFSTLSRGDLVEVDGAGASDTQRVRITAETSVRRL